MEGRDFDILKEEYQRVDQIINDYIGRQINYMNITLLLFGGSFVYLNEKDVLADYKAYYPYFLFLVYGLFAMDLYRIQIYQGYRKYLADVINKECGRYIINKAFLNYELILNGTKNWFYPFYTAMWICVLAGFYWFSHSPAGFMKKHALIQLFIIILFTAFFLIKAFKEKDLVEKTILKHGRTYYNKIEAE